MMKQKKQLRFVAVLLISFLFTITLSLQAQVPRTISFQGLLTNPDGSSLPDGQVSLDFMLYESETGGTAIWTETQQTNTKNGIFSVNLGKVTPLTPAFDKPYWVGIKVNGNSELAPRIALTASPYSLGGSVTVAEPDPGQNFQIKDSTGNVTHTLNSNGDTWSAGVGKFENGLVVGDTTVVPDTGTFSTIKINELKFGISKTLGVNFGGQIGEYPNGVFGWGRNTYTGVYGKSSSGKGVYGLSHYGDGIYGHSSWGWAGHFDGANVWIEKKLRIDVVPTTTETNYMVWSSDHFVKVNTTPPSGGTFDGVLKNKPLKIQDANGVDKVSLNTDGTTTQAGKATLKDGLDVLIKNGGSVTIDATGNDAINITNSNNNSVWKVNPDGTSSQNGKATLKGGWDVPLPGGGSAHMDLDGSITITDPNNVDKWKADESGNTTQDGLGTFNTGLKVPITGGGDVTINATGTDVIKISNNAAKFWGVTPTGSQTQTGTWSYMGPNGNDVIIGGNGTDPIIDAKNSSNASVWGVYRDGTTNQTGKATLAGGWSTTLNNGNTAELSPVDGWHIKDAAGNFLAHNDASGNAFFAGDVTVIGNIYKGGGTFKIDHPLDPLNKYLYHSFVESPDMMNVYNGNTILGDNGEATIELPDWFDALNKDFRYQLTPIGAPGPNLYVSKEIDNNTFKIAGGKAGMKVSWQVTGIRHDPYANLHRVKVEEDKPIGERGKYLHPDAYNQSVVNNK